MSKLLLNPWVLLGVLVLLLGAAGTGYYEGSSIEKLKGDKRIEALQQQARLVADAEAEKANEAATAYEAGRARARVIYRNRIQEVHDVIMGNSTVYSRECFDDAGLQHANASLAGAEAAASRPAGGMSEAQPAP